MALFLFAVWPAAEGANVIRETRKTIKSARYEGSDDADKKVTEQLNEAEKNLMSALEQEENLEKRAEFYYTAALVQCRINDIENAKIYLGKAYDTAVYYSSIYKMYRYLAQCDSAEASVVGDGRRKYRPVVRRNLLEHRITLLNGGRFYLHKKDYAEAYRFLDVYLSSAGYPMFRQDFLDQTDTMYARVAYWATAAAYHIGEYGGVVRHAPVAYRYPGHREYVQEYLCKSYLALNDTVGWLHALKDGIANFPDHTYFFNSLMVYLNHHRRHDEALLFAEKMLRYDPKNHLFWLAKAMTCMHMEDYPACIANCNVVLTLDSMDVRANFFKGLAYCNMAHDAAVAMEEEDLRSARYRSYKMDVQEYYTEAVKPLERVRRQMPDRPSQWAPPLYQVYLNLNRGKEFDEMEQIVRSLKTDGTDESK